MAAAVAYRHHDEAQLGQAVGTGEALAPGDVHGFHLRPRIHVIAHRIDLRGIEVKRLVDGSVQVRDAVGRLYLEALGELIPGRKQL